MGRRKTPFSDSRKTTWSVSLQIDDIMRDNKGRRETIDQFLDRVFTQWKESQNTITFLEDAYNKQSIVVEKLNQELSISRVRQSPLIQS